jgi:hypothetical protein
VTRVGASECGQRASFNRDRDLADEPHWYSSLPRCGDGGELGSTPKTFGVGEACPERSRRGCQPKQALAFVFIRRCPSSRFAQIQDHRLNQAATDAKQRPGFQTTNAETSVSICAICGRFLLIACHAEAVCEGRSILGRWLGFRRCGCLSFAWPFRRLCNSSVTNCTDFLLLFGRDGSAITLATFLAFLPQLLLVQISLVLFIGKTTAETSGGNCQCRCNFYWPATRYHMPRAFIQRIVIRKRKLTITRSTLMRHTLSYRGRLESSNAQVATRALPPAARDREWSVWEKRHRRQSRGG